VKKRGSFAGKVRTVDIPVPRAPLNAEELLSAKLGSKRAAESSMLGIAAELGVSPEAPHSVLAAIAMARLGADLDAVAKLLDWKDFEGFCAMAISAAGYNVRRNVRLRKPTRQIDIVAESPSLVLVVDCKHWRRGVGQGSLEPVASAQAERTRLLVERTTGDKGKAHLPVVLTVVDNQVRVVGGVPIVPIQGLKDFLSSVNRFDPALSFLSS